MSAATPPRADSRGGNQSEDSFEISKSIFTQSVILCLFAESQRAANELLHGRYWIHSHRVGFELLPEAPAFFRRHLLNMTLFLEALDVVGGDVFGEFKHDGHQAGCSTATILSGLTRIYTSRASATTRGGISSFSEGTMHLCNWDRTPRAKEGTFRYGHVTYRGLVLVRLPS